MQRVHVVPHTHWDREWYEPFQVFRHRLLGVMDQLVDLMTADPSYRSFLADGQMAMLDDYLEVRPSAEGPLRDLASSGRLSVGPWYVLMDEHLVSGETIIRNLERGLDRARDFGEPMPVGYLPDMFGHVAQMPQILALAGFRHAVVWRGVPAVVRSTGFWWEAPDGSRVRAEYLPVGYANGAALPADPSALSRRLADHLDELADFLRGPLLLMNGSDHLPPQAGLPRVVSALNATSTDLHLEIGSLLDHLEQAPTEDLPLWRGELRSGARADLLIGVVSNRVDVKQAAARAERALERRAEPLAALFLPASEWPQRLLDLAWLEVIRNSAHDSICACSATEVIDAVLHRFAEAQQMGEAVAGDGLRALARSMARPGPVVVNLSSRPRSGLVELAVAGESEAPAGVQVLSEGSELPGEMTLDASAMRTLLGLLRGSRLGDDTYVQAVDIGDDGETIDVRVTLGTDEVAIAIAEHKQELYTRLASRPGTMVRLRLDQPSVRRVVARVADVPRYGWRRFEPAPLTHPVEVDDERPGPETGPEPGRTGPTLTNGLVTVSVDPLDGTFAVDGITGFGRLVDGGDQGDSYNYSPPRSDSLVAQPLKVATEVNERGPVRARVTVRTLHRWPEQVDEAWSSRTGEQTVEITTVLEVRADEPIVRISHSLVNRCRDHRLRVHLPLPAPAFGSEAETAFGTVVRGLEAEGRPDEPGLPTYPALRFVRAGGLTVAHDGVHEYELVDLEEVDGVRRARTLALTFLRATGMLSRLGAVNRPLPAGPLLPVESLQLADRTVELRYGLALGTDVDPWWLADELLVPLEPVPCPGGGWRPESGSALEISGAEVSAVRRRGGALEVRLFNPTDDEARVDFGPRGDRGDPGRGGTIVDLQGRPLMSFRRSLALRPWGIATVRLPDVPDA